jgi:hypothetical protein
MGLSSSLATTLSQDTFASGAISLADRIPALGEETDSGLTRVGFGSIGRMGTGVITTTRLDLPIRLEQMGHGIPMQYRLM